MGKVPRGDEDDNKPMEEWQMLFCWGVDSLGP